MRNTKNEIIEDLAIIHDALGSTIASLIESKDIDYFLLSQSLEYFGEFFARVSEKSNNAIIECVQFARDQKPK
jgi:predicted butyrate kinase (DUF1464 family)